MLLCHFFHSQFLGERKKSLDTLPLFLFSTDAYLFNRKHLNFWSLPLLHYFLLNCLAPYGHLQILLHQLSHSLLQQLLSSPSYLGFHLLPCSPYFTVFLSHPIHFSCHLLTHNSYLYFSFSPEIQAYISDYLLHTSYVCQPHGYMKLVSKSQLVIFFFFFTLTCYSFCLSYETLSWSIEWSKPSFWNNTRIFLFPHLTQHTHPVQIILTLS